MTLKSHSHAWKHLGCKEIHIGVFDRHIFPEFNMGTVCNDGTRCEAWYTFRVAHYCWVEFSALRQCQYCHLSKMLQAKSHNLCNPQSTRHPRLDISKHLSSFFETVETHSRRNPWPWLLLTYFSTFLHGSCDSCTHLWMSGYRAFAESNL